MLLYASRQTALLSILRQTGARLRRYHPDLPIAEPSSFVNVGHSKDITRATISRWLKTTIESAYLAFHHMDGPEKPVT